MTTTENTTAPTITRELTEREDGYIDGRRAHAELDAVAAEENRATGAPAWLDLNGYCPPMVRDDLTSAAEALEALFANPAIEEACFAAYWALLEHQAATVDGPNVDYDEALNDLLHQLSGFARLQAVAARLANLAMVAVGENPHFTDGESTPRWFRGFGRVPADQAEWIERAKRGEVVLSADGASWEIRVKDADG